MRRPTAIEVVLAAALAALLGGAALWRLDAPDGSAAAHVRVLPVRAAPASGLLADEGIRLFASRQFPQACERFNEALEREPDNEPLRGNVARCFGSWGWEALRAGRPEEAMLLFRQGLRQVPEGEDLLKGLGVAAIHAGQGDLAVEPLEHALRERFDPDVALVLARLYDQRDDAARAVAHLRRLLAARPDNPDARRLLEKLDRERAAEAGFSREESRHFVLKYRGVDDADVRRTVLRTLEHLHADIGGALGHHPAEKTLVILYPEERFQEVTGTHDWVGGLFDGKIRLPAGTLALPPESVTRLLAHECTHAIVHQIARGRAPRWLQEGLAQHFEGLRDEDLLELPRGLTLAGVEALLTSGDIAKARTGYRTALWLVRDLLERGGMAAVSDLLSRLGNGETVSAALQPVYGLSLQELEAQWRLVLGGPADLDATHASYQRP